MTISISKVVDVSPSVFRHVYFKVIFKGLEFDIAGEKEDTRFEGRCFIDKAFIIYEW